MLSLRTPADRVPSDHPLRRVKDLDVIEAWAAATHPMNFRVGYFVIGFHHEFVGIADATQGGTSVTNDAEHVVGGRLQQFLSSPSPQHRI
jgi:hypothetical protein